MTDMPQLVSLFNAVGGGAAAAIRAFDYLSQPNGKMLSLAFSIPVILDLIIGSVTFSGVVNCDRKISW